MTLSFKEAADVSNKVVAEALRGLAPKRARNRGVAVKPGEVRAFARILRDARAMTDEDERTSHLGDDDFARKRKTVEEARAGDGRDA